MKDKNKRCILFTGHRIDAPDRAKPRFPASAEPVARSLIADALTAEIDRYPESAVCGISSGANGGDILFLEACRDFQVPAEIYLARSRDEFIAASVADGGPAWTERFTKLTNTMPVHYLPGDPDSDMNVWQQTNLWMLETALSVSQDRTTVIALWDGDAGDAPGGTTDMVMRANDAGMHVVRIDALQLTR